MIRFLNCFLPETLFHEATKTKQELEEQIEEQEQRLKELTEAYDKLKLLLEQKDYLRR